ncbi:hypothetical protein D3C75_1030750 [compost metagenome]
MMFAGQHDIAMLTELIDAVNDFLTFIGIGLFRTNAKLQGGFSRQVVNATHQTIWYGNERVTFNLVGTSIERNQLILLVKISKIVCRSGPADFNSLFHESSKVSLIKFVLTFQ